MKRIICLLIMAILLTINAHCLAYERAFNEVYKESRNVLSIAKCKVTYDQVVTGEILLQGTFDLINETDKVQQIQRVCLTIGRPWLIDATIKMPWQKRMPYLYTGKRDEEIDFVFFWEQMLTDMSLFGKYVAPGETVTANFAAILEKKRDIDDLQVLLQDMCFEQD